MSPAKAISAANLKPSSSLPVVSARRGLKSCANCANSSENVASKAGCNPIEFSPGAFSRRVSSTIFFGESVNWFNVPFKRRLFRSSVDCPSADISPRSASENESISSCLNIIMAAPAQILFASGSGKPFSTAY